MLRKSSSTEAMGAVLSQKSNEGLHKLVLTTTMVEGTKMICQHSALAKNHAST